MCVCVIDNEIESEERGRKRGERWKEIERLNLIGVFSLHLEIIFEMRDSIRFKPIQSDPVLNVAEALIN